MGAYKPLNWMNAPNRLVEEEGRWVVEGSGGEQLTIVIEEVVSDSDHELGVDPGLEKDGVEAHLQQLLAAQPGAIIPDLTLVRREYPTDIGPVDLLCRDPDGGAVAIEVKRRGEIDGVEQLARYVERLNRDPRLRPVRGVLVAQVVKPQARVLAVDRDLAWWRSTTTPSAASNRASCGCSDCQPATVASPAGGLGMGQSGGSTITRTGEGSSWCSRPTSPR